MRVLINCETSGVSRKAFQARGHEVYSCDILPADDGETRWHIQADAISVANEPWKYPQISNPHFNKPWWDLMIAHPPCTYLCNSGVGWLVSRKKYKSMGPIINAARWNKVVRAVEFFRALLEAQIDKIAIENPIPHCHGLGKTYDQIIQPFQFGHPERKATCLWLKGLPKLIPTKRVPLPVDKRKAQRLHYLPPSKDRWKIRSKTFQGIAEALADQYGLFIDNPAEYARKYGAKSSSSS